MVTSETTVIAKRKPGRPSKLVPEVKEKILSAVRCGASYKSACIAAGVSNRVFYNWKARAEEDGAPPEYVQFLRDLKRAEQEGQVARLALIQKAARDDWRAAAWLAERFEPERLSLKYRVEHSGKVEHSLTAALVQLRTDPKILEATPCESGRLPNTEE